MFLETVLLSLIILIILVFLYRQAVDEFQILQTDDFTKVPSLLQERLPIVVHPFNPPENLWSRAVIQQRPKISKIRVGKEKGQTLGPMLKEGKPFSLVQPDTLSRDLATQLGMDVWTGRQLLPHFHEAHYWGFLVKTSPLCFVGPQGLRPTTAYASLLFPTEGTLRVSLLHESSDAYLPPQWRGRQLSTMTRDDSPLIGEIQTVEVIVRSGSALIIPPHWRLCWTDEIAKDVPTPSLSVLAEFHHPVSQFVSALSHRLGK
jgi:hypothetical protein